MTRRSFLIAGCALAFGRTALAQSRGARDPISGTWTGDMAPQNAARRTAVTLELAFDGQAVSGSVTGPDLTPGDIVGGAFDAKTGALKFEVVVKDDGATRAFFEGTVINGTATGRVSLGSQTGDFKITKK